MDHIVKESIRSFKCSGETLEEAKDRIIEDTALLTVIFNRVQNDFKDVKSLKRYIKNNKI